MTAPQPTHEELTEIAARILRLAPSRIDPEQFFVDRDELAKRLRALARQAERRAT